MYKKLFLFLCCCFFVFSSYGQSQESSSKKPLLDPKKLEEKENRETLRFAFSEIMSEVGKNTANDLRRLFRSFLYPQEKVPPTRNLKEWEAGYDRIFLIDPRPRLVFDAFPRERPIRWIWEEEPGDKIFLEEGHSSWSYVLTKNFSPGQNYRLRVQTRSGAEFIQGYFFPSMKERKKWEKATKHLQRLRSSFSQGEFHFLLGSFYARVHYHYEASREFQQAAKSDERYRKTYEAHRKKLGGYKPNRLKHLE